MPLNFTFLKAKKPKAFNYKPLYYDAAKEDLDNRIKAAKAEYNDTSINEEEIVRKERMSKQFERQRSQTYTQKKSYAGSQLYRTLIIAGLLAALAYLYLR